MEAFEKICSCNQKPVYYSPETNYPKSLGVRLHSVKSIKKKVEVNKMKYWITKWNGLHTGFGIDRCNLLVLTYVTFGSLPARVTAQ